MSEEQVLVISRSILEQIGLFHGISFDTERYLQKIRQGDGVEFMLRSKAEQDSTYKQLIPYVIISHKDTYLCYTRGKRVDEQRLAEKASIGIGGHVNPSDNLSHFHGNFYKAYLNALIREVNEEVTIESPYSENIVGLINDDSNDVGRVHFGIIHFWRLTEPKVRKREQVITKLQFMTIPELYQIQDQLESWSQLCLQSLNELGSVATT